MIFSKWLCPGGSQSQMPSTSPAAYVRRNAPRVSFPLRIIEWKRYPTMCLRSKGLKLSRLFALTRSWFLINPRNYRCVNFRLLACSDTTQWGLLTWQVSVDDSAPTEIRLRGLRKRSVDQSSFLDSADRTDELFVSFQVSSIQTNTNTDGE